MRGPRRPLLLAALAAAGLGLASPSSLPSLCGLLVLPGLAALFLLCMRERCALWVWLAGVAELAFVSRSLVHVVGPGIVAIAMVGAVYWLCVRGFVRAFARAGAPALGFACGVAVTEWLRAHMPEIPYPHAQPCHVLAAWPPLLGPLRFGGEPFANFLLAWIAARAVTAARRRASLAVGVGGFALSCVLFWLGGGAPSDRAPSLRVQLWQSQQPLPGQGEDQRRSAYAALQDATAQALGGAGASLPDLVVWPESSLPSAAYGPTPRFRPQLALGLPPATRLLASSVRVDQHRLWAIAALCDGRGALLDWQEKRVPVPVGERIPGLGLLPEAWAERLLDWCTGVVGFRPDLEPGGARPPLTVGDGVRVGALICFDNAFDRVVRREVEAGARLLVVLSNESWYEDGVELDQMLAMSACRAVETGTPLLRSTVDGLTCAISARGEVLARLPRGRTGAPASLGMTVPLGPGALPPLAWLHDVVLVLLLSSTLFALAQRFRRWGRLAPSHPAADLPVLDPGALDSSAPHRRP
ncbi:MAG: apolipoprotein N-acyltransferase [Planctomycetota bacterium]